MGGFVIYSFVYYLVFCVATKVTILWRIFGYYSCGRPITRAKMASCCTRALQTFSHKVSTNQSRLRTASTNHKPRLRSPTARAASPPSPPSPRCNGASSESPPGFKLKALLHPFQYQILKAGCFQAGVELAPPSSITHTPTGVHYTNTVSLHLRPL